jgi:hypothetical protein
MKNLKITTLVLLLSVGAAFAQEPRIGVGIAGVGRMPLGDTRDVAEFGFGGLAGIEMGTYPGVAITARSGFIQHMEHDDYTVKLIPIMGGAKFNAGESGIYLAGELGAVITRLDYDGATIFDEDVDETNFGWGVGVGSMAGPIDIRISFDVWDAGRMQETMTVGLSLGFTAYSF